jgi:signal transduction histidine kinase/YHS domain-containing protein
MMMHHSHLHMTQQVMELCCLFLVVLVTGNVWFYVRVLRPIQRLALHAADLERGNLDALEYPCEGIPEIMKLRHAMASLVRHIRRSHDQTRLYADQLTTAQEMERKRIAQELHDETIQMLIAIAQSMDMAKQWVITTPTQAITMLQMARQQVTETIATLRNLIGGLRPPALEELGLVTALRMLVAHAADLKVHLHTEGAVRRLQETHELTLFRVAQEALSNIRKHSHAHHATLTLIYAPMCVTLQIEDDGCGFMPPLSISDLVSQRHYGLAGIHERVQSLKGSLTIQSQPNIGTLLTVQLPVQALSSPMQQVQDPVCGMLLEPEQIYNYLLHQGQAYYFCCPVCQGAFEHSPSTYHLHHLTTGLPDKG